MISKTYLTSDSSDIYDINESRDSSDMSDSSDGSDSNDSSDNSDSIVKTLSVKKVVPSWTKIKNSNCEKTQLKL